MAGKARVLVVANRTAECDELLAALRDRASEGPAAFTLLVPATAARRGMGGRHALGDARGRGAHAQGGRAAARRRPRGRGPDRGPRRLRRGAGRRST